MPWKADLSLKVDKRREQSDGYIELDSLCVLIHEEPDSNADGVFSVSNFVIPTRPPRKIGYSWEELMFPVFLYFSEEIPYSEAKRFQREIYIPEIANCEVSVSRRASYYIQYSYPSPDMQVITRRNTDDVRSEWRWYWGSKAEKSVSSIIIKFQDLHLAKREQNTSFQSRILLAVSISTFVGVLLNLFKYRSGGKQIGSAWHLTSLKIT